MAFTAVVVEPPQSIVSSQWPQWEVEVFLGVHRKLGSLHAFCEG